MPVDASTLSREHAVRLSAGAISLFESYAKRCAEASRGGGKRAELTGS
jgi:hypothetical protein